MEQKRAESSVRGANPVPAKPVRPQVSGEPATPARPEHSLVSGPPGMLWMQQTAGNTAIATALAESRSSAAMSREGAAPPRPAEPPLSDPPLSDRPPSDPPLSDSPPIQLTDLAGGNDSAAELFAGVESDFAAQRADAMEHLTGVETRLGETQAAAADRLDASHRTESAVLADRTARSRAAVTARHAQHRQHADATHAAHLATAEAWQAGQDERITGEVGVAAAEVRGRTNVAGQQVRERTNAAHNEANAHIEQRRQDIRGIDHGGAGTTPRENGHAQVGARVSNQADRDLASRSADSLAQLRGGGVEAAGKVAAQGESVADQTAAQAPALHAQVGDTVAGARAAANDVHAHTHAALGAAHDRSLASIAEVRAHSQAALTAQHHRARTDLVETSGRARRSVRDAVHGALAAAGAQLRSTLAPLGNRRLGRAKAARIRAEMAPAIFEGGARMRQRTTDSAAGIEGAVASGGNAAAGTFGGIHAPASAMLDTVQQHHDTVGADMLSRVDEHQQQAGRALTTQGGEAITRSLGGITQAGQQAVGQLDGQAQQISGHIDTQAAQTRAGADQAVSDATGRVADGKSKVDAKLPAKKPGGFLAAIGDWFKQQWNDLVDMIKDPGFWVGLVVAVVVTIVLAPALGPFALVIAGAAAGAAAQMTHNVITGKPLFNGVLKAAALGALGGAVFAVATAAIVLGGLEGLAALAVLEVATVIATVVTNAITGQRLTKGLLANMLLVGILHTVMKYFSGPVVEDPAIEDPAVDKPGAEDPGADRPGTDPGPDQDQQPVPDQDQSSTDQDQSAQDKDQHGPEKDAYVACFLAGTPVLTQGGLRPIETIRPGDQVYGRPAAGGRETALSLVSDAFRGLARHVRQIRVAGGDVLVTPAHQFRLGSGQWKRARDLVTGDELETFAGTPLRVESMVDLRWPAGTVTHNLTVPEVATYFVGIGDTAVLVHNANPPKPLPNFERPILWIFGNKPLVRDTDVDGKSMWRTNSKAEVDKLFEARVNVDGRPESDPHIFYDEADVVGAGIQLPETPGQGGAADAGLTHLSARPPGADPNPAVDLTATQQAELQARLDALPKPTKVTPKMLKGTCG